MTASPVADRPAAPQPTAVPPRTPGPEALAVWRLFLRTHAQVTRQLEHELLTEEGLPLGEYDVLVQLVEAPERQLRMTELADRVLLSRSGLTRLVDRMERDGLVARQSCPTDARGVLCTLQDAGADRLRRASGTHLRGVAEHVTDRLDATELAELGRILGKVVAPPSPRAPVADEA